MRYLVEWAESALTKLASFWINADDTLKRRITLAANQIDKELRDAPAEKGESRDGAHRIFMEGALGILFLIEEGTRKVVVTDVWLIRPRKKP